MAAWMYIVETTDAADERVRATNERVKAAEQAAQDMAEAAERTTANRAEVAERLATEMSWSALNIRDHDLKVLRAGVGELETLVGERDGRYARGRRSSSRRSSR